MRLVFWQNCLSPHQLPYIVHLMDDKRVDEVVFVAIEKVSDERKKMGWKIERYDGIENCKVCVDPDDDMVENLLAFEQERSVHIFSGIHGFPFVFDCLKRSLKYNVRRGIITELPNTFAFGRKNGKPLWVHQIRFWLQDRKYAKHIDYVFAMGQSAVQYFRRVYANWRVFPFMYCTDSVYNRTIPETQTGPTKFVFVGSLSYWKSPLMISNSFASCKKRDESFNSYVTFVGDGKLRTKIEKHAQENKLQNFIRVVGFQPQSDISKWLAENDILILPSIYDGWGAVVNEALQAGLYVICSDACGAADLLKDKRIGQVFHCGNINHLTELMKYCNEKIKIIRRDKEFRKKWAEENISGSVVAQYMIDCLTSC